MIVAVPWGLFGAETELSMLDLASKIAGEGWFVLTEMAPYLLFGFLVAGLLSIWISAGVDRTTLGDSRHVVGLEGVAVWRAVADLLVRGDSRGSLDATPRGQPGRRYRLPALHAPDRRG